MQKRWSTQELNRPRSATTTQTTTSFASQSGSSTLPPAATPGFPVIMIANLTDLQVGTPVSFNYPLEETPNILVKLGQQARGGVGPDNDIVAFSQVCQHLGCIYAFVGADSSPACDSSLQGLWASRILLLPRKCVRSCERS